MHHSDLSSTHPKVANFYKMRSLIFRPSGIHTPWNKLIMIMLNYQKQNLPSWILCGCPGTVSHLFIDTGFMACFFSTTASALAIEADAVLRDPRCLNERCPVLGQGSWTCCLNQLKDLRDSLVSLLEIKELLLNSWFQTSQSQKCLLPSLKWISV